MMTVMMMMMTMMMMVMMICPCHEEVKDQLLPTSPCVKVPPSGRSQSSRWLIGRASRAGLGRPLVVMTMMRVMIVAMFPPCHEEVEDQLLPTSHGVTVPMALLGPAQSSPEQSSRAPLSPEPMSLGQSCPEQLSPE